MNFLDNVIGFFSPYAGLKREAYRQMLEEQRHYDAGNHARLNAGWSAFNLSAELTDRNYRDQVRARARDLERNSDIANSVIIAFKRNVVGAGWTLQADTGDTELNNQMETLWKEWTKAINCDVTGAQSLKQILRMAVERKKVDGGILFKKCYTEGGLIPFKLQLFEVDELDETQTTPKNRGNKVVGGIEYNSFNKAVGYWIKQFDIQGYQLTLPKYTEAKDMIFYYSKRRPSQVREMSDMAQTITRIRDTNEFMTAVSVKERIAACLAVFIKKAIPTGTTPGRNLNHIEDTVKKSYEGKTISPGMIKELNTGDEVQVVNPSGQATDAADYIKQQQRLIGSGQGLSYEATSRDMSQSTYSSARQGIIEDELTYIEDAELLVEKVLDEVYETFVISCVLSGLIAVKEFWSNKSKYLKHTWVAAAKKWIDPLKEANASKIALQSGQKTFKQVAAENGKDWRDQIDEMSETLQYGEEKGIDLGGILYGRERDKLYIKEKVQ